MSKKLLSKWQNNPALVASVISQIHSGLVAPGVLSSLQNNDRLDLQGIPIPKQTLKTVKFEKVDFSYADISGWWSEGSRFKDVIFFRSDMSNWRDHGNTFEDAILESTKLTDSGIGFKGSKFIRCIFRSIDFRKTTFNRAEFYSCEFNNCRLNGVDFFASSFENCKFKGSVDDVWFRNGYPVADMRLEFGVPRPNMMKNVDFRDATLSRLTFSGGCDLSTCFLTEDQWTVKFSNLPQILDYARRNIGDSVVGPDAEKAKKVLDVYGRDPNQYWYIINFRDIAELISEDLAMKIRQLLLSAKEVLRN